MAAVLLSLGSNEGYREKNLKKAIAALASSGSVSAISSIYETEPVGEKSKTWFLNCCLRINTDLKPLDLLARLKSFERALGRDTRDPLGSTKPRPIDCDILFYDAQIIEAPNLCIPHPRLHLRRFVLQPLVEIAPDYIHPKLGQTVRNLLKKCADASIVRLAKVKFPNV